MESYCNFYAFVKFGIKTLGTVSIPPAKVSGIITSLNSSSWGCLAVISNIKMPSVSAFFFPQYILKWLKKKQYSLGLVFFFLWWKWEKETEDDSSKPVNRSGLSPQWNFRAHTPVCSLSNIVTQKSLLTLTESALEWKGKLLKCSLI